MWNSKFKSLHKKCPCIPLKKKKKKTELEIFSDVLCVQAKQTKLNSNMKGHELKTRFGNLDWCFMLEHI